MSEPPIYPCGWLTPHSAHTHQVRARRLADPNMITVEPDGNGALIVTTREVLVWADCPGRLA